MSLFSRGKDKLNNAVTEAKAKVAEVSKSLENFKVDVVNDLNRLKFDVDARLKALEAKVKSDAADDAVKEADEAAKAVDTAVVDVKDASETK